MASSDYYRNKKLNLQQDIARFQSEVARENIKLSEQQRKVLNAQHAMTKATSYSTLKSRCSDLERAQKKMADCQKKIAQIQEKIARKEKELSAVEKNYINEMEKETKKRREAEKKLQKEAVRSIEQLRIRSLKQENQYSLLKKDIDNIKKLPNKITILFLASNAIEDTPLKLDKEAREIQEKIRKSEHRDSIIFETRWAVRTSDILQAINETNPTIIHFSGHGTQNGELILFNNVDENYKIVTKEAIAATISTLSDSVRLVVFNACFSGVQAENIVQHVDAAIGMDSSISDEAAILFASQLYSSIGFGRSVDTSFKQAIASLLLEGIKESDTPKLFYKEDIDKEQMILVSSN